MNTSGVRPGEQQVTGEQRAFLGQPRDQVSGGVGRAAGVQQVDPPATDMQAQRGTDRDVRKPAGDRPPVRHRVPQRRAAVDDRVDPQPFPHLGVPEDHRRRREQAVAVGVVAVLVGVDRHPYRAPLVAASTASRNRRVRAAVAQVSITSTPPSPATAPALLTHQLPSG
jgi:hypothetical protein